MNGLPQSPPPAEKTADFWTEFERSLTEGSCLGALLLNRRSGQPESPEKITIRAVEIKGTAVFQWALRRANQETHENLSASDTAARMRELLPASYEKARVFTAKADFDLRVGRAGELTVRRRPPSKTGGPTDHNRTKAYLLPENEPSPFLVEIGVMTPAGKVRASKQAKFRQINRFLELVNDVAGHLPKKGVLHVVDFGCGKSYLTFALYHLLTRILKREVKILGLDRKREVVAECARLSRKLDCRGLEFRTGDIAEQNIEGTVDLAVSLHACDTATDDALAAAIALDAAVILAVPCCQHELAARLEVKELAPVERHGVLHEHFASLATDALRAQALEACGYKTQVIEFIDVEHTAKNLLIRAVRQGGGNQNRKETAAKEYDRFKAFLGLGQIATDRLLRGADSRRVK